MNFDSKETAMRLLRKNMVFQNSESHPDNFSASMTTTPQTRPEKWSTFTDAVVGYVPEHEEAEAKETIPAYEFNDGSWWVLNGDVRKWYPTVLSDPMEAMNAGQRIADTSITARRRAGSL